MNHNEITSMAREAGLFVPRAGLPENGALIRFFHAAYAAGMGMTNLRTAAQQALEACKLIVSAFDALKPASAARNEPLQINAARASITALEAALAEPQEPGCRDDGMPTSAEERHLRRLLALRAAMPHAYYDDGEAQGTEHGIIIDFMREPVAHIDAKLRALNVARAIAKQAEPVQDHFPDATKMVREPVQEQRERELNEALTERDDAEDYIDALLDEVLGPDRAEWSSAYGRADALEEVRERIAQMLKPSIDKALNRFEAALEQQAQPVQEPVAWMYSDDHKRMLKTETFCTVYSVKVGSPDKGVTDVPLFTAPPQRKPLTREQAIALWADKSDGPSNGEIVSYCRAVERAHKIGGEV